MNRSGMKRITAHARGVGAAPQRRGDIIDGISLQERQEIRRVLTAGENIPIPQEKRGVCFEEEGKYSEAGHAFRVAAVIARKKNLRTGIELVERAVRNFALAGNEYEATATCRLVMGTIQLKESEGIVRRLVEFCETEAREAESTQPHRAGGLLKVASCLINPFDFVKATYLMARGELLKRNAERMAQSG